MAFLCVKNYHYASFSIPKDGSHGLTVWRHCFHILFSWEMLCDAIPHSVVLFLGQSDGTSFLTCYDAMKKVVAFNSTLFQQLQWNKLSGIPNFLPSHEAEHSIVCFYPVKRRFSLMSSSIFPSFPSEYSQLLAKHNGADQQHLCSHPKMFYLPSDTATAHAVSAYSCWNHVWISDMRISSFTRNSINAHCQSFLIL